MKPKWQPLEMPALPIHQNVTSNLRYFSEAQLKIVMEEAGYVFQKKYQASEHYIHRKIANADVLISVGSNIANFNGYIEINESAADLWMKLQEPSRLDELEQVLEQKYGISHETAVQDVLDFISLLKENNMVVIR